MGVAGNGEVARSNVKDGNCKTAKYYSNGCIPVGDIAVIGRPINRCKLSERKWRYSSSYIRQTRQGRI